jgi:hypothetical protein
MFFIKSGIAIKIYFLKRVQSKSYKKKPNSFMSRLKIEKSVVLFEKWRH